jgi:hypothetical protein
MARATAQARLPSAAPSTRTTNTSHQLLLQQLLHAVASLARHMSSDCSQSSSSSRRVATPFHSSAVPPVPLAQYAHRVVHYSGYGAFGLQLGLALLGRYVRRTGFCPTPLTAHRLLATCIVVGMKANCDHFVRNKDMAAIVGVPLPELNALEFAFVTAVDYAVMPTVDEVIRIPQRLSELDHVTPNESDRDTTCSSSHHTNLVDALCLADKNNNTSADTYDFPTPRRSPTPLAESPVADHDVATGFGPLSAPFATSEKASPDC